jgi:hypothetical protein
MIVTGRWYEILIDKLLLRLAVPSHETRTLDSD